MKILVIDRNFYDDFRAHVLLSKIGKLLENLIFYNRPSSNKKLSNFNSYIQFF